MSGGALNYVYQTVHEAAGEVLDRATIPEHVAFAQHLFAVSAALRDLEWVWSGDYGPGRELDAINAVLGPARKG